MSYSLYGNNNKNIYSANYSRINPITGKPQTTYTPSVNYHYINQKANENSPKKNPNILSNVVNQNIFNMYNNYYDKNINSNIPKTNNNNFLPPTSTMLQNNNLNKSEIQTNYNSNNNNLFQNYFNNTNNINNADNKFSSTLYSLPKRTSNFYQKEEMKKQNIYEEENEINKIQKQFNQVNIKRQTPTKTPNSNYYANNINRNFQNYFGDNPIINPSQNNNISTPLKNSNNININNNNNNLPNQYYLNKPYSPNTRLSPNMNINNTPNININNSFQKYNIRFGFFSRPGTNVQGITKTNQDSFIAKENTDNPKNNYTFGVFDGHGADGHFVSGAIKEFFNTQPFSNLCTEQNLILTFKSLSNYIKSRGTDFDVLGSGSTCVLIHISLSQDKIYCANVGDSRSILISENLTIFPLSIDHKPELYQEKMRILNSGGRVSQVFGMGPFRVWLKNENYPGLAMSRSIGDGIAHSVGVSDIPEIKQFIISDIKPLAIVTASDGVWEFMKNEDVREIVQKYLNKNGNTQECAREICDKSRELWVRSGYAIDDITCVVTFFK